MVTGKMPLRDLHRELLMRSIQFNDFFQVKSNVTSNVCYCRSGSIIFNYHKCNIKQNEIKRGRYRYKNKISRLRLSC